MVSEAEPTAPRTELTVDGVVKVEAAVWDCPDCRTRCVMVPSDYRCSACRPPAPTSNRAKLQIIFDYLCAIVPSNLSAEVLSEIQSLYRLLEDPSC